MKLYIFRTVPLSIIRSFSLYTQQWYMSYRFADSYRAGSGWNILILIASWWWTEELSETCTVSFQNEFDKLVQLVSFIIRIQRNVLEVQVRLNVPEFYLVDSTSEFRPSYRLLDNFFSVTILSLHVNDILIQQRILPHSYFLTIHDNLPITSDTW